MRLSFSLRCAVGALLLVGSFTTWAQSPQPVLYGLPTGVVPASDFKVWINGRELPLYDTRPAAVGSFSLTGNVVVEVQASPDVRWVDVRPKSRGIVPQLTGKRIRFTLDKPGQFSVELNNDSRRVLHLFANAPETGAPNPQTPGLRYFRAGVVHRPGLIELRDGEQVYIEAGAIVKGAIRAVGGRNIRIGGRGILDGDSLSKGTRLIYLENVDNATLEGITLVNSHTWTVEPIFSRNVVIDNLKIVNWDFGSDGIDVVGSSDVRIRNSFVRANDDCIVVKTWRGSGPYADPQGTGPDVANVVTENCVFWNMPWGNALEIGFELRAASVRDITFRHCDIIHVERGAAMSIHNGDFATVENVLFEDIRVEDARHKLIDLAVFLSQYSNDRPTDEEERKRRYLHGAWDGVLAVYPGEEARYAPGRGRIRNVTFRNIRILDGPLPFSILAGYDARHNVENIRIDNLTFHGQTLKTPAALKLNVQQAKGVQIR